MPRLGKIHLDAMPEQPEYQLIEVRRPHIGGKVIPLALNDLRREVTRQISLPPTAKKRVSRMKTHPMTGSSPAAIG
jgi:hypothetical protein